MKSSFLNNNYRLGHICFAFTAHDECSGNFFDNMYDKNRYIESLRGHAQPKLLQRDRTQYFWRHVRRLCFHLLCLR